MSGAAAPDVPPALTPEDQARAGYYALLARLYYAGPDARLLEAIAGGDKTFTGGGQTQLVAAWNALAAASAATDAGAARLEYDQIFVGTGKAVVTLYASHYLAETGREKILVRLKDELSAMGLARSQLAHEPEDHVAALLDVMRHLISQGSSDAALQQQRAFFNRYIEPFFPRFCDAISAIDHLIFYQYVGAFARAFFGVESEALKVY